MKKAHLVITLLFLLIVAVAKAQQRIELYDVDLIVYTEDDTDIKLFKMVNDNEYMPIHFELEGNYETNFIATLRENLEAKTIEELDFDKEDKLLYIKDLPEIDPEEIRKTTYKIIGKWEKEGEETNELILKFLNPDLAVIAEKYYGTKKKYGGLGSAREKNTDDQTKRWRIFHNKFSANIDLCFSGGKHIFLLNDGDHTDYLFLPLKEKKLLISYSEGIAELQETTKYKTPYKENFATYEFDDFLSLVKDTNKYSLQNQFHKNVLPTVYDTISYNNYFIIAKNDRHTDIYNMKYKKLPFRNVKAAYLYRSGFEILDSKGARYYNSELQVIYKFPEISYMLCGTVSSTSYKMGFDKKRKKHTITVENGSFGSSGLQKKMILKNIKRTASISFLDDKQSFYWDENDSFIGTKYGYPNYIKVFDGKKYGIYEFSYDVNRYVFEKNKPPIIRKNFTITGKEVLPIAYDAIKMNYNDGLIYFYKDNKVGIFPRDKKVVYDAMQQVTNSFYSIERNGIAYWLDINTNIEYLQ